MENPEEILHSLEEFAKMKPKDIPRELEEYLKFVAKTGDPIYQWSAVKSLFREKLINVIQEFYESCSAMEIPPCPNVDMFNYDLMKNFILEKLDTFSSAPFTVQRICELLTSPRKEYTRIDKYMRALEKNILVVSTTEPGGQRTENGEGIMNGIESEHDIVPEPANEINVEEMDDSPYVQTTIHLEDRLSFDNSKNSALDGTPIEIENSVDTFTSDKINSEASTSNEERVFIRYVTIEPVAGDNAQSLVDVTKDSDVSVTITAVNVKEDDSQEAPTEIIKSECQPTKTDEIENVLLVSGSTDTSAGALTEHHYELTAEIEPDYSMETECVDSTDTTKIKTTEIAIDPVAATEMTPSSTTVSEKMPEELSEPQIASNTEVVPESTETQTVSPENSITSSDCSTNDTSVPVAVVELQSSNVITEIVDSLVKSPPENQEDDTKTNESLLDSSDAVDSTTKASGDTNNVADCDSEVEKRPENEEKDPQIPVETQVTESIRNVGEKEVSDVQLKASDEAETNVPDVSTEAQESPKTEQVTEDSLNNVTENPKLIVEEAVIDTTKTEEVSSSDEKVSPMEVDETVSETTSGDQTKEENPKPDEPESSEEPPENP